MQVLDKMVENKDTMGWPVAGLLLAGGLPTIVPMEVIIQIISQGLLIAVFPTLGWLLLYFVKREITYRFPPKDKKALLDENLDNQ